MLSLVSFYQFSCFFFGSGWGCPSVLSINCRWHLLVTAQTQLPAWEPALRLKVTRHVAQCLVLLPAYTYVFTFLCRGSSYPASGVTSFRRSPPPPGPEQQLLSPYRLRVGSTASQHTHLLGTLDLSSLPRHPMWFSANGPVLPPYCPVALTSTAH